MWRALICLFLTLAPAMGSQAVAAPPTWADWVGDYRGALTWRQCTAPGEARATLAIDAVDGAVRIDLAPAGAALRALTLTAEDGVWIAQDGDVSVRVARKQPNTIELAVTYESGCTVRGKLARTSTGVPACDRMVAWSRIAAACTKTAARDDLPAKRTWKAADAPRCAARADTLAHAMIEVGCAPHPDPEIAHRARACRALVDATQKLARCGRVPPAIQQRLAQTASALSAAAESAERATLPYVEQQCTDARAEVAGTAVQFQCQL